MVESEPSSFLRVDSSWNTLVIVGGICAILSAVFLILDDGFQAYLDGLPYTGYSGVSSFLTFVQRYSNIYYGWYISYALAVIFGLVFLFGAFVVLSRVEKTFALIGTALGSARPVLSMS